MALWDFVVSQVENSLEPVWWSAYPKILGSGSAWAVSAGALQWLCWDKCSS